MDTNVSLTKYEKNKRVDRHVINLHDTDVAGLVQNIEAECRVLIQQNVHFRSLSLRP